jgi:hypothetical protein
MGGAMAKPQPFHPRIPALSIFKRDIKVETFHIRPPIKEKPLTVVDQEGRVYSMYRKLRKEIEDTVTRARANNKKILITIGENHGDKRALIIELLIINLILEKNLLTTLTVEAPQSLLDTLKNEKNAIDQKYLNLRHVLEIAEQANFTILPIDPNPDDDNELRHEYFKQATLALNQDVMFVTGINHLAFLHEDEQIRNKYESLAINAANVNSSSLLFELIFSPYDNSDLLKVLAENSPYINASLPSDLIRMEVEKVIALCKNMCLKDHDIPLVKAIDAPKETSGVSVRRIK